MRLERSKNAKRNIVYGIINKLTMIIVPFILRTVIIYFLGAEYLGLGSLFSSILQVLNLTELGFSSAVVYSLYDPIARNDDDQIRALMNFYKKAYRIIGCVILAAGLILLPFLPHLIKGAYPAAINIYALYLLYLINTVISYWCFAYRSVLLNAYQRVDITSKINLAVHLFSYSLQVVVLFLTRSYYAYTLCLVLATILNNLCVAWCTNRLFPNLQPAGSISRGKRAEVMEKVKGLMIDKLCKTSRNAFDSIFVSAFFGLVANAIYGNYFYIMNAVTMLLSTVSTAILGGIGNSIAMDSPDKNYDDMNRINFIYMWIAGWCTICLLCLYQPFTALVYGKKMLFPMSTVILFCVYFYALTMGDIRHVYASGCGLWWQNRYRAVVEAVANVGLNFILGYFLGVNGIVLGTLISLVIVNFFWGSTIIFKYYFVSKRPLAYFASHGRYLLVTLLAASVTYGLASMTTGSLYVQLVIRAALCILVPNLIYLTVYRRTAIYRQAMPWALRIVKISPDGRLGRLLLGRASN